MKIARPKKSEQKGEKGEFPYTLIEFKEQIKELAAEHNWGMMKRTTHNLLMNITMTEKLIPIREMEKGK
ncbi:hypothetical protein SAMN05428981_105169 [Bacillus sp. OV194]|nr:hypothetical protein SAMN05428981_105169 [Bacillus sp. OV194]